MAMSFNYTAVATGANTTQVIVAAQAGRSVTVHGYCMSNAGSLAGTAQFLDSAGGVLSGAMTLLVHGIVQAAPTQIGCMKTPGGKGLSIASAAAGNLNGWVVWSLS